jgi:gamma-glutamyltranspeptidase/glutathione hydrolase
VNFTRKFLADLEPVPGFATQFLGGAGDEADPDGVPKVDTLRRYPALADTLQALASRGLDDFYRGELAQAIAAEHERLGSPLRLADLQAHRARTVAPLRTTVNTLHGEAALYNMTPPTQGLASLMILALFDRLRQRHGIAEVDSTAYLHAMVEATKQALRVRNRHIADPATMAERAVNAAQFLAPAFLDQAAAAVDMGRALTWPEPAIPGDTIWMGTADAQGRMVSYIQSVYLEFGSGVVLGDTGLAWQNRGSSFLLDARSHLALAPRKEHLRHAAAGRGACAVLAAGQDLGAGDHDAEVRASLCAAGHGRTEGHGARRGAARQVQRHHGPHRRHRAPAGRPAAGRGRPAQRWGGGGVLRLAPSIPGRCSPGLRRAT